MFQRKTYLSVRQALQYCYDWNQRWFRQMTPRDLWKYWCTKCLECRNNNLNSLFGKITRGFINIICKNIFELSRFLYFPCIGKSERGFLSYIKRKTWFSAFTIWWVAREVQSQAITTDTENCIARYQKAPGMHSYPLVGRGLYQSLKY